MQVLAFDIGGANIKAADGRGLASSVSFSMWKHPDQLAGEVARVLTSYRHNSAIEPDLYAITMTGELADCFTTKADGVRHILSSFQSVAGKVPRRVYLTDGTLVDIPTACDVPLLAAASNWHALANFCTRFLSDEAGLLIDIGSTTADIIPITKERGAIASARTDPERLACGELVYTGVRRSPICALVDEVPWRGSQCTVAQEVFATTLDAYLVLGEISEDPDDSLTADGRPAIVECAQDRLARSICADRTMFSYDDALSASRTISAKQLRILEKAATRVISRLSQSPETIVLSGTGEFLGAKVVQEFGVSPKVVYLSAELGSEISACGPAHALAVLAMEQDAL